MPSDQTYTSAQLYQKIDELRADHATWLAKIENDRAQDRQELAELRVLLATLTQSAEPMVGYLESAEPVPEVTISHDMLANGTWRYKTSVTMSLNLDDPRQVVEALARVDQLAKVESQRRMREVG